LVTPLLREGTAIGVINIRRTEFKPFTEKQVALLETFASQAVIAIENVRLFKELQERIRNYVKPWSIRRRRPKCSVSSAARRRTCSRYSMP
jgi:GAF domain-containing protein